jgi:hypothetical protein
MKSSFQTGQSEAISHCITGRLAPSPYTLPTCNIYVYHVTMWHASPRTYVLSSALLFGAPPFFFGSHLYVSMHNADACMPTTGHWSSAACL